MPVSVEWVDEPHIFQVTFQGKITTDEIIAAWQQIAALHDQQAAHPFCGLGVVLPDHELPLGLLQLATHPLTGVLRHLDAAVAIGVDHFLFGMYVEMLSRLPFGPSIHVMESYSEALNFLRQVVRSQQDGV